MSAPIDVKQNPDGSWTAKGGTSFTVVSVTALTEHKAVSGHAVAITALLSRGKGWIKCEDQMPQQLLSVLAAGKGGKVFNLYRQGERWLVDGPLNGQHQGGEVKFLITHWQPLPSPPTE